jgi:hypothetical protein
LIVVMEVMQKKFRQRVSLAGSALILTVVLTSLLAIVGVLFVMLSRIDKMATTATSESRKLNFAVDTILARICEELALDVPGANDPNQEYYDYPDANNVWLAGLEPYKSGDDYFWGQISDVTGFLGSREWDTNDILISNSDPNICFKAIIPEYKAVLLNSSGGLLEQLADADGDGVADSKWFELNDVTSSKGKPIYAAVRIVDNSGMLNVNTGYKFDPNSTVVDNIDGSSVLQVNLMGLASRSGTVDTTADEATLLLARANYGVGVSPLDLIAYEENVIWQYGQQIGSYTPFDISDELELRYRFVLNNTGIDVRVEQWGGEFRNGTSSTPFGELDEWLSSVYAIAGTEPNLDPNYAYRHVATTCNMDRIINPAAITLDDGTALHKMVNVNTTDVNSLHKAIRAALIRADPNFSGADGLAAQMAVNMLDYRDADSNVVTFDGAEGSTYYGFEAPCIYISEVAYRCVREEGATYVSYAIELYKPYFEDGDPNGWEIVVDTIRTPISWSGSRRFHVIRYEDTNANLPVNYSDSEEPVDTSPYGYNRSQYIGEVQEPSSIVFGPGSTISLQRSVEGEVITVDSFSVPDIEFIFDGQARSIQRDITLHKCIRRLWAGVAEVADPTLGRHNSFISSDSGKVQAHPANKPFTNIGEIGMVLRTSAYSTPIGCTEADVRIDLVQQAYANLFNYLTVFDPNVHGYGFDETRIKGRININTAPWFVIAQLPWVSAHTPNYWLAKAVVAYRDKTTVTDGPDYSERVGTRGFRSISELMQVSEMDYYALDSADLDSFPDLTPSDGAEDDFEERDVIFSRISNLITVRSDVFTACILVRLGADGPQRRIVALLDRSGVSSSEDKVRIMVLHTVPDPR